MLDQVLRQLRQQHDKAFVMHLLIWSINVVPGTDFLRGKGRMGLIRPWGYGSG